jgi:2'-5' RNA ligase
MPGPCPEHLRLFVAIRIPAQVKDKIAAVQTELRSGLPTASVRWARAEQFHLTLRFLGAVVAGQLTALTEALRSACEGFPPLQLRASGIGFFPGSHSPRVIWAGINDLEARLPLLHHAVQSATREFTNEKLEEAFTGHVTVGRIKQIRARDSRSLAAAAARLGSARFGEWTANQIEIMRSNLLPEGASHTCVTSIPLDFSGV